jgi:plasmid maintenance system killer protein
MTYRNGILAHSSDVNTVGFTYVYHRVTIAATPSRTQRFSALQLAFESKSLRTLCESDAQARLELGDAVAEILKHRLADIRAANSAKDLLAGRPRELDGPDSQHMSLDLCNDYRIVFKANHTKNPTTETDRINWSKVNRIKIVRINDSND